MAPLWASIFPRNQILIVSWLRPLPHAVMRDMLVIASADKLPIQYSTIWCIVYVCELLTIRNTKYCDGGRSIRISGLLFHDHTSPGETAGDWPTDSEAILQ